MVKKAVKMNVLQKAKAAAKRTKKALAVAESEADSLLTLLVASPWTFAIVLGVVAAVAVVWLT